MIDFKLYLVLSLLISGIFVIPFVKENRVYSTPNKSIHLLTYFLIVIFFISSVYLLFSFIVKN